MERTRWNDDLETWCDERYYRKDEVDEMISQLELNSGLVFSVEIEDEVFSVDSGVQDFRANLSWSNGTGVDGKNEHMASFKYDYRIDAVRDWIFNQTLNNEFQLPLN